MAVRLIAIVLSMLIASRPSLAMSELTPQKKLKLIALGDSTTAGTPGFMSPREAPPSGRGDPESQYAYWMEKSHPYWSVLNRGVRGQRTDQILKRFDYDVLRESPDAVIILAGVNDVHQEHPVSHVTENLMKLYERARANHIQVIACTVLPYNLATEDGAAKIAEINDWIKEYSSKHDLIFCDTNKALRDPDNSSRLLASPDDIHPDADGYRKMADVISSALSENLQKMMPGDISK